MSRQLNSFGFDKPALGYRLDRGHLLSHGLISCYLFNEGGGNPIDLVKCRPGTLNGDVSWTQQSRGTVLASTTAATTNYVNCGLFPASFYTGQTECTIVMGYAKTDVTARVSCVFADSTAGVGANNRILLACPWDDGTVYWQYGNSSVGAGASYGCVTAAGLTFGNDVWVLTASAKNGGKREIWQNGLLRNSNTAAASFIANDSAVYLRLGGNASQSITSDISQYLFFYIYNRCLSAAEIQKLSIDPYQVIQPTVKRNVMVQSPGVYTTVSNTYCTNRAAALSLLWAGFTNMGWFLADNQDASSYRVYGSSGDDGSRIPEYIKINWATANTIYFFANLYWNTNTHIGTAAGASTTTYGVTTSESGFYLWVYGSKNLVSVWTKVASTSTYYHAIFGHLSKRVWTIQTNTIGSCPVGCVSSYFTVNVVDTTEFVPGAYYQIVGQNSEGRNRVQVVSTSLTPTTAYSNNIIPTMTSNTLPSPYVASASGSIAWYAFDFTVAGDSTYWQIAPPCWLQIFLGDANASVVTAYQIYSYIFSYSPNTWTFAGSNTGAFAGEQTTLDSQSNITTWINYENKFFTFSNTIAFKYYRLTVQTINGSSNAIITSLKLYKTIANTGSGGSITIAGLISNNYDMNTNAIIGQTPSAFHSGGQFTCLADAVRTTNNGGYINAIINLIPITSIDPDQRSDNCYILQPLGYTENNGLGAVSVWGYCDQNILLCPTASMNSEDILAVNQRDPIPYENTNTSTGSNDSTHLNDTNKAWATNTWAGKSISILLGQGAGQIRVIASNTSTQIVINTPWVTIPDGSSTYVISDEAYRYMFLTNGYALLENL